MMTYKVHQSARLLGCCVSLSWLMASPVASAVTLSCPMTSINVQTVTDQTLSQIIGRGVIGGTIVYFGVQMQTNWTSPHDQSTMQSTMNIALNSQGNIFKPTITYNTLGKIPASQISSGNNSINGEGLNNTHGVTQAIQIGGTSNSVQNKLSLNVINGAPTNNVNTGTAITAGQQSINGVTLTVQPGQLSMALSGEGASIRQGIGSNGLYQISQVKSNMNNIQNRMSLTLGINPAKATAPQLAELPAILNTMRGIQ
ncbi:hypothetical protein B1757_09505 [Acidithiobacillus marinus]|uniref:Fap system outer membrane protein n=1 Tax=Acidithiobacillus marinus TaxID=187490 RepID=A0A2I1DKD2_9PROT|nr:hypothetical protein [Acidithiobacillus marinus]PKY10333.1 hypothetical protein B1757_09505 [Acidithiobacillus marinus]